METGDKIPISDINSDIRVDTLKEIIFECEYFKCFTLEKNNGYYKHICKSPNGKTQTSEYNCFLDMFYKKLDKIK